MQNRMRLGCLAAVLCVGGTVWIGAQAVATAPPAAQAAKPAPPLPTSKADLRPTESDDRLFVALPAFEVGADGASKLTFTTAVPIPACRVFVGTLNPSTTLETPFFPVTVRESLPSGTTTATAHPIAIDLKRLDSWIPAAGADGTRAGEAHLRIEAFDPRTSAARYIERRVHYRVAGGRYTASPTILYGPFLDLVTSSSATVSWDLDRPALGSVEVWSADGTSKIAEVATGASPTLRHIAALTGLKARQAYTYRVALRDAAGGPVTHAGRAYPFRTAPTGSKSSFSFVYLSDGRPSAGGGIVNINGASGTVTPRLLADSYRRGAEFALYGGDLQSGATSSAEHLSLMLDSYRLLNDPVAHVMPIYEGVGNHEILWDYYLDAAGTRYSTVRRGEQSTEALFAQKFVNPANAPEPEVVNGVTGPPYTGTAYSFDYGNSHLVMLNSDYWLTSGGPSSDRHLGLKLLGL